MRISSQLIDAQIEHVDVLPTGIKSKIVYLTTDDTLYYWDTAGWAPLITVADTGAFVSAPLVFADSPKTLVALDKGKTFFCNTAGGAISVTLPAPEPGMIINFKDVTGNFATNAVTIVRNGAENIEGLASSYLLQADWGVWTIASNGVDWFLI